MIGFAAKLSGRRLAPLLVVLLSLAASLRPVLRFVLGPHFFGRALPPEPWPQAWIFQASWAPQHLASAGCVVIAVLILSRLAAPRSWPLVPLLAVIVAAGFESSTWVGGVIFAVGALPIGVAFLLAERDTRTRIDLLLKGAAARHSRRRDLVSVFPRRISGDGGARCRVPGRAAAVRGAGRHPAGERSPAARPGGLLADSAGNSVPRDLSRRRGCDGGTLAHKGAAAAEKQPIVGFALLGRREPRCSLAVRQHDRQQRPRLAGRPARGAGADHLRRGGPVAMASHGAEVRGGGYRLLGDRCPGRLAHRRGERCRRAGRVGCNLGANPGTVGRGAPAYGTGRARRQQSAVPCRQRRWPVNISWALFADRRSCFAGWNLARAFVPLPAYQIDRINGLFERVFSGAGSPQDIRDLATLYDCRVIVLTAGDGALRRDPFAGSRYFRLVDEKPERWRIYRMVGERTGDRNRAPPEAAATRTNVSAIR